ncbi:MAG: flagellar biosynthesis protein FlhB [Pseudomonadota bacterium]
MPDDSQDESQKTEDPTQHKLKEALRKGQVAFSREVTSFFVLFSLAMLIIFLSSKLLYDTKMFISGFIEHAGSMIVDGASIAHIFKYSLLTIGSILMIPALAMVMTAIISSIGQNGLIFSGEPIIPKLEKISVIKGLKRMFSLKSVVELIKGVLKITAVSIICFVVVYPELIRMETLHTYSIDNMLKLFDYFVTKILIGVCIFMGLVAVADYLYQRHEYIKNLRMSKRDIKDEIKQTDGNPEIKAKLRQIRMQRARQRMMTAVPTADVIITNPTHFSIALKYDDKSMAAPICVAKGQDLIALTIRKIAAEHNIPLVENPPLARALFASVEIDEEIPLEHYKAVAEVIAYVYNM